MPRTIVKTLKLISRKWLYGLGAVALVMAFVFYLHPLVSKDEILRFFSGYYFPSIREKSPWYSFASFKFIFCFMISFIAGVNLLGATKLFTQDGVGRKVVYSLLIAGLFLETGFFDQPVRALCFIGKEHQSDAGSLREMDEAEHPTRSIVAINDVGAIKFFGERRCLDLEGLVSPEIIPYKILGEESYIVYLNKHRPDYFIVFPVWYPVLSRFLALEEKALYEIKLHDNIACGGGGDVIVAQPDWEFFDSTFQKNGPLKLKPNLPQKSVKRRWYDSQERQGLFPDWRVYQTKALDAEAEHKLKTAEKLYQKAESYDPQDYELYLQMAMFYEKIGDFARAKKAIENAAKYELFPLLTTSLRESRK
jgi:hypothetical protein